MGSTHNYVPMRLRQRFREAQQDERFLGWLKMEEAAMPLIFQVKDAPELTRRMYTEESVPLVERSLLDSFESAEALWETEESTDKAMRYAYYVGETFRRSFDGTWAALPSERNNAASIPVVDLPYRESFIDPVMLLNFAVTRRTGDETAFVYRWAKEEYNEWTANGRPERIFKGTLREGDG